MINDRFKTGGARGGAIIPFLLLAICSLASIHFLGTIGVPGTAPRCFAEETGTDEPPSSAKTRRTSFRHYPKDKLLLRQNTKDKLPLPEGQDTTKPLADKPILITSDKVEYLDKKKVGEFTGNVKAVQGKLTLTANRLKVRFDEEGRKIGQIVATGKVRVVREDLVATSKKAVFYNKEQKMVLTGNPRVSLKDSRFSGERITVFMKEDRFIIERKVRGLIVPEKRKKTESRGER